MNDERHRNAVFQTNPRGVGGHTHHRQRAGRRAFQTNPRGVGGATTANTRPTPSFQTNPRGVGGTVYISSNLPSIVSDQPSWGRRSPT